MAFAKFPVGASARVLATGSFLPKKVMTNHDFAPELNTSDEWIVSHTGISRRHIAGPEETTSFMAAAAARRALETWGGNFEEVDAILVATTTPDRTFPGCASYVQSMLGCNKAFVMDVQGVCCGFLHSLALANSMIASGFVRRVLVIGAETMSRILDWNDRTTCVLFADGAGAFLLEAGEPGIMDVKLYSDGSLADALYTDGGVVFSNTAGHVRMSGRVVFRHAVEKMAAAAMDILHSNGFSVADIDWLITHQANYRIMEALAEKLLITQDKVLSTIDRHANTSAASIPIAVDHYNRANKIARGSKLLLAAIGGGMSWGAALMSW